LSQNSKTAGDSPLNVRPHAEVSVDVLASRMRVWTITQRELIKKTCAISVTAELVYILQWHSNFRLVKNSMDAPDPPTKKQNPSPRIMPCTYDLIDRDTETNIQTHKHTDTQRISYGDVCKHCCLSVQLLSHDIDLKLEVDSSTSLFSLLTNCSTSQLFHIGLGTSCTNPTMQKPPISMSVNK